MAALPLLGDSDDTLEDWERFFAPAPSSVTPPSAPPANAQATARTSASRLTQARQALQSAGHPPASPSRAGARPGRIASPEPDLPSALAALRPAEPEPAMDAAVLDGLLDEILEELAKAQWQSDERFVESFVHRHARKQGALKIRQGLQQKGVAPEQVKEAMASLRDTEFSRAQEAWRKRFGTPPLDAKARAQQMRFLAARGFAADTVRQVLARAGAPDPDEDS